MADITDRPSSAPPETGITGVPPRADDDAVIYRPLSLLALAGFLLSLFTVVAICLGGWIALFFHNRTTFILVVLLAPAAGALVSLLRGASQPLALARAAGIALAGVLALAGLGGLLAYTSSDPWLWPSYVFLLPAVALVVAWLGRSQIFRSEDTLSGLPLCNWGLGLVGVFTLLYVAYYGAAALGVRVQSEAYADEWLKRLENGELDRAFLMTLSPDKRPPEDDKVRATLENYFNQAGPNAPGPFDDFTTKDYVHLMQSHGPTGVKVEPRGLQDWKFENGEQQVRYAYHITSALIEFDLLVLVKGVESQGGQFKGRQWYVDLKDSGLPKDIHPMLTAEGRLVAQQLSSARDFLENWLVQWYRDDDAAYLATLTPAQRDRTLRAWPAFWAAAGTVLTPDSDTSRAAYHAGGLVEVDPKIFYAGSKANVTAVPAALRRAFGTAEEKPSRAIVLPIPEKIQERTSLPVMQATDGGKRVVFDLYMIYLPTHKVLQNVDVDARILVDCDDASLATPRPKWRIAQLQLLRARTISMNPPANKGPGGPVGGLPGLPGGGP